jgi:hypothetical protein
VTYLDGKLYVVTGYCPGDFVLTAEEANGQWRWGSSAWGGKGDAPSQFRTAHGKSIRFVEVHHANRCGGTALVPSSSDCVGVFASGGRIYVANREAHEVLVFEKDGTFVRTLPGIPDGSR